MICDDHPRVVIVGAGHSGGACALELRRGGYAGCITVLGEEQDPPYERPALSKAALIDRDAKPKFLCLPARWSQEFDLRLETPVVAIDRNSRNIHLEYGEPIPYDYLVIATGGRARNLRGNTQLKTLRTLRDSTHLASQLSAISRVLIVGGGLIGLEVAASLRTIGHDVIIVESTPQLLSRNVPTEIAEWIRDLHLSNGTNLYLGRNIVGMVDNGPELLVHLDSGDDISCSLGLAAIGMAPRIELAQACGLPCTDGILVDTSYRSVVDPNIYAIGDVAVRVGVDEVSHPVRQETWSHAQYSANAAARAILGLSPMKEEVPWFWTDQFGHSIQIAGVPAQADDIVSRGTGVRLYMQESRMVGAACIDSSRDFALAKRLIAARTKLDPVRLRDPAVDMRKAVSDGV